MRILVTLLIAGLCCAPSHASATGAGLDEISVLARSGAPGLALTLLDRAQPELGESADGWTAFETERLHILGVRGLWNLLDERVSAIPDGVPESFRTWAMTRQAEARLALEDAPGARAVLRDLIWRHGAPDADALREWRRLIVRSYIIEDDSAAALTALQRYAQDYGDDDPRMRVLHAEVLLAADRAGDAAELLRREDEARAPGLISLAELRSGRTRPGEIFERAVHVGSSRDSPPLVRKAAWRVAAEAALRMGNPAAVVASLERALVIDTGGHSLSGVVEVQPRTLWQAYRDWGRALGNSMRLIVGVDQHWLDAAEASDEPLRARALYATLAADTRTRAIEEYAHFQIARLLATESGGDRLLTALYLDPHEFPDPAAVPAAVRHALLGPVLDAGDISTASVLVADLDTPPAGSDPAEWALRRSRVLVLGGRAESGARALGELMDHTDELDVDRVLQVLFDLQSVEAHESALELFVRVFERDGVPSQTRREILYWMADSWRALGRDDEAARLYLRSATLEDAYAMDQWAQTARYQAADALASAGLHADAVVLYRTLLNAADDPARKAVLSHRIEQLRHHETVRQR